GRSPQVDMHRWGLMTVGLQTGPIVAASRDTPAGPLRWQIVLREDGALLLGGALPVLIEWSGAHPAQSLPDSGVALRELSVRALPQRAVDVMRLRGVKQRAAAEGDAAIEVHLDTPLGECVLRSA
ncbi:MAG: VOC family protein, partial [Leptothrix sp. (in: b-proteobacteria)]